MNEDINFYIILVTGILIAGVALLAVFTWLLDDDDYNDRTG